MSKRNTRYNEEAIKAFFNQCKVYDLIVRNNYMAHAGIHQALRENLSVRERPFSVIDLGCGDTSQIAGTLYGLPVKEYTGVDLAAVVLDEARKNMVKTADNTSFFEMDFIAFLESEKSESADVIVAGFAAHHLNDADKQHLFHLCSGKLNEGGVLYYFDVFLRQGETRDQFFEAYLSNMDNTWLELSPEIREQSKNHIINCDHPETINTIATLASEAGFTKPCKPLFQDGLKFHRLYCFTLANM